jgi:hypothetical protein
MTDEELVDLGQVLRAVIDLQNQFAELKKANLHLATQVMSLNARVKRLPCMQIEDDGEPTGPACPAAITDIPPDSTRGRLLSISDDEPNSVVTRPISVHAGMVTVRGPGIMIGTVVVLLGLIAAAVLVLRPMLVQAIH